jgi:hypothetical protein
LHGLRLFRRRDPQRTGNRRLHRRPRPGTPACSPDTRTLQFMGCGYEVVISDRAFAPGRRAEGGRLSVPWLSVRPPASYGPATAGAGQTGPVSSSSARPFRATAFAPPSRPKAACRSSATGGALQSPGTNEFEAGGSRLSRRPQRWQETLLRLCDQTSQPPQPGQEPNARGRQLAHRQHGQSEQRQTRQRRRPRTARTTTGRPHNGQPGCCSTGGRKAAKTRSWNDGSGR